MFTKEQLNQLHQLLKAEVEPLHERLDALRSQIAGVHTGLSSEMSEVEQSVKDLAEMVGDHVFPKFDEHDRRLTALEQEADLPPHKQ